ncbi:MAG: hypothetical protein EPN23_01470 [Verrucomicrobia bacterium]|nr:MAG: hypothetical protein EPN23_01470 [Verrucomicrobiota bacterium]
MEVLFLKRWIGPIRWLKIILPSLALVLILFIDHTDAQVVVTPLFALICIALMALWFTPGMMAFWVVFYTGGVYFALFSGLMGPGGNSTPLIRLSTFVISAVISLVLCWQRSLWKQAYERTQVMLQTSPFPVLLSDYSGNIVFANEQAARSLHCTVRDLANISYFTLFAFPEEQGKFIARYFEQFDRKAENPGRTRLDLLLRSCQKVEQMDWLLIQQGSKKILMTVWFALPEGADDRDNDARSH